MKDKKLTNWWNRLHKAAFISTITTSFLIDKNDKIIFDVGANLGYVSLLSCLKSNFKGKLFLFEPVPEYCSYIKNKVIELKVPFSTKIEQVACSSEAKKIDLMVCTGDNLGWNTIHKTKCENDSMRKIVVDAITLDEYCKQNKIKVIDVIKIDTEGAEVYVLKGLTNFLINTPKKPKIICEIAWGEKNSPVWSEEIKMFDFLHELGYEFFDILNQNILVKNFLKLVFCKNKVIFKKMSLKQVKKISSTRDIVMIPKS